MAVLRWLHHPATWGALALWALIFGVAAVNSVNAGDVRAGDAVTVVLGFGFMFAVIVRMAWSMIRVMLAFFFAAYKNSGLDQVN